MYVILKGSVNVRISKKLDSNYLDDRIVAVLYDGFHFGELAMMKTSTKKEESSTEKL